MRTTAIALSLGLGLGLCSLPSFAASLAEQFTLMEKGPTAPSIPACSATMALTSRPGSTARLSSSPCPSLNEQGKQEGESRYYFKGGKLFGVKEPAAQFAFDDSGKLTQWLDDKGAACGVCQQDEHAAAGSLAGQTGGRAGRVVCTEHRRGEG